MSSTSISNPFTFVLIPADESKPIVEIQASKDGGLSDDTLIQHAKQYFHTLTGANARASALEQASATERAQLAQQLRQQMIQSSNSTSSNGGGDANSNTNSVMAERIAAMNDDAVIETLYKSQMLPSCDITALTIPTAVNQYTACSMYAADSAKNHGLAVNARAAALLVACGHSNAHGVYGDVFCGRALDNEMADVWQRTDFVTADANPTADWCRVARSAGGGGGSGGNTSASSLSSLLSQTQGGSGSSSSASNGGLQIIDGSNGANADAASSFGLNGAPPVVESWGSWTQSNDDVELKMAVAAGTKSKYCKVQFGRSTVKVVVAGQTLVQGTTFDPIDVDECTFTLEDVPSGSSSLSITGRELCVTLTKAQTGRTWAFAVR